MKVSVFGSGYVGLTQAAVLAEVGHDVICMDIDQARIERLQSGQVPFYEPGLANLLKENCAAQRLRFTGSAEEAVTSSEVLFIAVGTPPMKMDLQTSVTSFLLRNRLVITCVNPCHYTQVGACLVPY